MISRRFFLKSGAIAAAGVSMAAAMPHFLARAIAASGSSSGRPRTLVLIFLRGAADGLNTVVPYGDRGYYQARPTIGIRPPRAGDGSSARDLDGFFGFHPALEPLLPLYRSGQLAVVHATGSPDATRSHFDAQDFMEAGTPGSRAAGTGWLSRLLDASPRTPSPPVRTIAVSDAQPLVLTGSAPLLTLNPLGAFADHPQDPGLQSAFHEMYASSDDPRILPSIKGGLEASRVIQRLQSAPYVPEGGARYPGAGPIGPALRQIAQLIKSDVGLEVAFTDMGGWDHHTDGVRVLPKRLDALGRALLAFSRDLGDRMEDVVVVTLTEFGRMVAENGFAGTDHGHGSCMMVLGGRVRGGKVYGRWPGLEPEQRFEGRDLAVTTDYRTVCGHLLQRHCGLADLEPVFPGFEVRPEERLELI